MLLKRGSQKAMTKIKTFLDEEEDAEVETTNCNISAQHKQNKASANIVLLKRSINNENNRLSSGNSSGLLASNDGAQDLRPKFSISKHKSDLLNSATTSSLASSSNGQTTRTQQQSRVTTPDWFFNIPTVRSPFPDFGSKLPPEDDE